MDDEQRGFGRTIKIDENDQNCSDEINSHWGMFPSWAVVTGRVFGVSHTAQRAYCTIVSLSKRGIASIGYRQLARLAKINCKGRRDRPDLWNTGNVQRAIRELFQAELIQRDSGGKGAITSTYSVQLLPPQSVFGPLWEQPRMTRGRRMRGYLCRGQTPSARRGQTPSARRGQTPSARRGQTPPDSVLIKVLEERKEEQQQQPSISLPEPVVVVAAALEKAGIWPDQVGQFLHLDLLTVTAAIIQGNKRPVEHRHGAMIRLLQHPERIPQAARDAARARLQPAQTKPPAQSSIPTFKLSGKWFADAKAKMDAHIKAHKPEAENGSL